MDTTNNIGLSKPDYNSIADIEVINGNSDIVDAQFSPNKWVKTVNGVAPVNHNVTVDTGVTSFNGKKGAITYSERSVKQLIDIIYPVGCYFDTTDKYFNPNTVWAGTTWEKVTDGRALIAGGNDYNIGTTYGDKTHKLTINELPSHSHSASSSTAGSHTHTEGTAGNHTHTTNSTGSHTHNRGTMNITGRVLSCTQPSYDYTQGAFYQKTTWGSADSVGTGANGSDGRWLAYFDASRAWTGETSSNGEHIHTTNGSGTHSHTINTSGEHSHSITIGNTGSNIAFNLLPPSMAVARWHRLA